MTFYSDSDRGALRKVFFRAWHNYQTQQPLEGIERVVAQVALAHPEYHSLLTDPELAERDYLSLASDTNPFLHLGLHIAVEEQLAIDQPHGVRRYYQELRLRFADEHAAQHAMMECLSETLWQAQQTQTAPDESMYLNCLKNRASAPLRS